jgi:GH24 family phage-related lysozyme (muramidase)
MENRFLRMSNELAALERARRNRLPFTAATSLAGRPRTAAAMSASDRVLVVVIENGGLDLGVGKLIDMLPGSTYIPDASREALKRKIDEAIRQLTDDVLEGAELWLNRYAGAKPEYYGDVVIIRNNPAMFATLRDTLVRLSGDGKLIDLFVLTHGRQNSIAIDSGVTDGQLATIRAANGGKPLRLRSVYMMNCVGSSLNKVWLDLGAKTSAGSLGNNYLPEPTTFFFFRNWKAGRPFCDAVFSAYQQTVQLLNDLIRSAAEYVLPETVARLLIDALVDLPNRQFVRDSAPVIAGHGAITIASDSLSFANAVRGMSFAMVPVSRGNQVVPRTQSWVASDRCLEFIKSFEAFKPNLYNDAAGHCTVGYGQLVHTGNCSGDASEAPYLSGISEAEAAELLRTAIADVEKVVNDVVQTELEQHQFDALVSFTYNVGQANLKKSTLLAKLNAGDYAGTAAEFGKWVNAGGNKLPGLVRRRAAEERMFNGGGYATTLFGVAESVPQPADPAIEVLQLAPVARTAAYALKAQYPHVAFTSGRRSRAEQASAMATNIMRKRDYVKNTYASNDVSDACQRWVDEHPGALDKETIEAGLMSVFEEFSDTELGALSRHLSGRAFDVRPVADSAAEMKKAIRELPGLKKFLEQEAGLEIWHAQF